MSFDRTRSVMPRAADGSSRLRLIVFCNGAVASYPLPARGELIVGRGEEAQVRIEHATVSRKHSTLVCGDTLTIVDHGSFNGTSIGGRKIPPNVPHALGLATIVELGDVMLVVQVDGAAPVTGSSAPTSSRERPDLSPGMQHLYKLADQVAQSNITVILRGETGAGKEVLAEHLHRTSARASRPLVKLNCAALPEHLLEGELFGYERGAFTGATQAKPGLIEAADTGTLFLDEVGELPLATQAKLLRVVESREVTRLGSLRPKAIDVRIVCATHRDLEAMVDAGQFRQDLYFRINGVSLFIPPLRERVSEIPRLASELVAKFCKESGRPVISISAPAMAALTAHAWPGNVRELRNVIERAVVFCRGIALMPEHFVLQPPRARSTEPPHAPVVIRSSPPVSPPDAFAATAFAAPPAPAPVPAALNQTAVIAPPASGTPPSAPPPAAPAEASGTMRLGSSLPEEMEHLERERILAALAECGGNQTQAADKLGISRRTLLRRLDTYDLPRPRKG
ncbi:MAG: sigma 54-interacting transcriptional regulator [Polyangiaceae bacterium]